MKHILIACFSLFLSSCYGKKQSPSITNSAGKETYLIRDYFPEKQPNCVLFRGIFKDRTTHEPRTYYDTLLTIQYKSSTVNCMYFKTTEDLYYIDHNIFFNGACQYRDNGLYVAETEEEARVPELKENDFRLLFPNEIYPGFSITLAYGSKRTIKFTVEGTESVRIDDRIHENCLRIRLDDSFAEEHPNIVWLKKNNGMIKWNKSTGRIDEMIGICEKTTHSGNHEPQYEYYNKNGDKKLSSEMVEGQKHNSQYSRAVYNSNGLLSEEVFYGSTGEMEASSIDYVYNDKQQLVSTTMHYSHNGLWVDEFFYDQKDRLIEYRSKIHQKDDDYYLHVYLKYDEAKNTFGRSSLKDNITCDIPMLSADEIINSFRFSNIHPLRKKEEQK